VPDGAELELKESLHTALNHRKMARLFCPAPYFEQAWFEAPAVAQDGQGCFWLTIHVN
jgi:hypothetical protein